MTYATQMLSINWLFRINGTEERAQTGLMLRPLGFASSLEVLNGWIGTTTVASGLCTHMSNLWATASGLLRGEYASLYGIKIAALSNTGAYVAEPYVYSMPTPVTGGSANVPPSSTVCVSLNSGLTLGRANRGRMYLPYTLMAQGVASATATTTTTTTVANATKTFINAVNNTCTTALPGASVVIASSVGSGVNRPPTNVRAGSINDVQRRRRNRLPEVYSTAIL
jgi:hypothetical protein